MQNPATIDDVTADWGELTDDMKDRVQAWIDRAWRIVKRVPSLVERLEHEQDKHPDDADQDLRLTTVDVIVSMVVRRLKNPRGLRSFGVDDGQATLDWSLSTGEIYLSEDEHALLAPDGVRLASSYSIPLAVPYWDDRQ